MSKVGRMFFGLSVVFLLVAAGCGGGSARESLYGRWSQDTANSNYVWDFKADGVLFLIQGTARYETTYVFVDDDTITVEMPEENGGKWTFDIKIEGDSLSLTMNGLTQTLDRVK